MIITKKKLRQLIEQTLGEGYMDDDEDDEHPLASDDNGISAAAQDLIQQLAEQILSDIAQTEDIDIDEDMLHSEAINAVTNGVTEFLDAFYMR